MKHVTILVLVLTGVLVGCVAETKPVDNRTALTEANGVPSQVLRVPQQLQDLSGLLLRYQAKRSVLPATLEDLLDERLMSPEEFAALPDYAYHPRGLGRLSNGREVILVDSEVRIEGHVWCIIREPDGQPKSIQLNVTPISLPELEAAARRGS